VREKKKGRSFTEGTPERRGKKIWESGGGTGRGNDRAVCYTIIGRGKSRGIEQKKKGKEVSLERHMESKKIEGSQKRTGQGRREKKNHGGRVDREGRRKMEKKSSAIATGRL